MRRVNVSHEKTSIPVLGEPLHITYYLDVISQWCYFADIGLDRVRQQFGKRLALDWKIALVNDGKPFSPCIEAMAWVYARSKSISGIDTNAAWRRPEDVTLWINVAAEAARALGYPEARRALASAALIDGLQVGSFEAALYLACNITGIASDVLVPEMASAESRVRATTTEYRSLPVGVVPCLVIRSEIGDTAIFSGLFETATFELTIEEMLRAVDGYASFAEKNPPMPTQ